MSAPQAIADLGAGLGVLRVGMAGVLAGAGLDDDVEALAGQRLDHVGDQRDAALALAVSFGTPNRIGRAGKPSRYDNGVNASGS